jgi:hypothetical protein
MTDTVMNRALTLCIMRKDLILVFIVLSCMSCKKNESNINQYENIPQIGVNIYLQLDQPAYFNLSAIGGHVYLNEGARGVIVYRTIDAYKAYERHSPHRSNEECAFVSADSSGIYGVEECDGIKYYLLDGTVATGDASVPLLQYQTQESQGTLHVYN